jgi:hypothetical protein
MAKLVQTIIPLQIGRTWYTSMTSAARSATNVKKCIALFVLKLKDTSAKVVAGESGTANVVSTYVKTVKKKKRLKSARND